MPVATTEVSAARGPGLWTGAIVSGFLYFACVLTGVLSGGAIGMVAGTLIANSSSGKWPGAVVGAIVFTLLLLRLGRKLHRLLNEPQNGDQS